MSSPRKPLSTTEEKDQNRLKFLYTQGFHNPGRMTYDLSKFAPKSTDPNAATEALKESYEKGHHNPGRMTYDLSRFRPNK